MQLLLTTTLFLSCLLRQSSGLMVRTPATESYFAQYRKSLGKDFNVVQSGGWYALQQKATAELGAKNLAPVQKFLPKDFSVVEGGGYYTLQLLAADPKGILVQMIQDLKRQGETDSKKAVASPTVTAMPYLDTIMALLHAQGKGFDSQMVDGEWTLVLQRQGAKSAQAQQLVGKVEKQGNNFSNFDVKKLEFYGHVQVRRVVVDSTVKYRPVKTNFEAREDPTGNSKTKKIILRRIMCDITSAGIKLLPFLPRLPLPFLKRTGGYLDFVYLDPDLRITRGNQGGLFVHARPAFVQTLQ